MKDITQYLGVSNNKSLDYEKTDTGKMNNLVSQEKSFADVLRSGVEKKDNYKSSEGEFFPLKPIAALKNYRGNIVVEIDEEEYYKGIVELKYNITGKLTISRGIEGPSTMEIKRKLSKF